MELPVPEVIFVSSELTIIEYTVVLSQFDKLIRDYRESVSLVIKFFMSGVFLCTFLLWISTEEGFKNLRWNIGRYTL